MQELTENETKRVPIISYYSAPVGKRINGQERGKCDECLI